MGVSCAATGAQIHKGLLTPGSSDNLTRTYSISAKNLNNIDITMEWLVKHAKNPS